MLPDPDFTFQDVENLAVDAHVWYKEKKFQPSTQNKLQGQPTNGPWYN